MFTHEYYMKQALQEAQLALEKDEVPVGCIVVLRIGLLLGHII